jgi:CRISPR-associated protein Csm5
MKYRLTALTPLLVGDGHRLSPIDYMVWKNQISVLDQHRIFKLLARGPRLEGYLMQLRKAEKLDFASWGGFAQNYAERRIPFEHASLTQAWESQPAEQLHIPTFCAGPQGPFLPASALKGALRTGLVFSRWNEGVLRELAARQAERDRPLRRPGEAAESMTLGSGSGDPMRAVSAGDSAPVLPAAFRIYMLRTAALTARNNRYELAWKTAGRGYAPWNRPSEGTPVFAEMAPPRTQFTGAWKVTPRQPVKQGNLGHERIFQAANEHASKLLELHWHYAEATGLVRVKSNIDSIGQLLQDVQKRRDACLLNLGWAGGFLSKAAFLDTANEDYRKLLRILPFYERAIRSGMPFPKTRRIIFEGGEPANVPGWALLEVS